MTKITIQRDNITAGEDLKLRMILVKSKLRSKNHSRPITKFIEHFGNKYNTAESARKVQAVWNTDTADAAIISDFEQFEKSL